MIRFDRVSYAYPSAQDNPVIRDLSFTIGDGEEIAVMGANGCGKTTVGLLLAGIIKPASGRITIQFEIDDTPDEDNGQVIGFLFQDPDNGLVATTVEREVAFSLENRNMPSDRMRPIVENTLRFFDMLPFRGRLVWNLSGGEKQRLSLAGLFASEPRILFLDEPASFLDHPGTRQLDTALRQFKEAGSNLTIIRVTQYPRVAEQYSRILLMSDGEIIDDGPPGEIFSRTQPLIKSHLRPPLRYLEPKEDGISGLSPNAVRGNRETALVAIDGLSFSYENGSGTSLLDDLSLEIYDSEVLGLVGLSGCGKSTFAQILCGIYKSDAGSIRFRDDSVSVAMSFQQPERQFFLDTAYDEIIYGIKRKILSNTSRDELVMSSMDAVGLSFELFRDRDPYSLSGGEARRLAFAIVMALDTDLVIFDEPTCGLDESGIGSFRRLVRTLQERHKTIIIISHNSDIIAELSGRVALLRNGGVESVVPTRDFFTDERYKEVLSTPEVIEYQMEKYGHIATTRAGDIFDLVPFCA